MGIIKQIKAAFLYKKIKKLDSKYFAVLCKKWKQIKNLDNAWCFPYDADNPKSGHGEGDVPISVAIKAMLRGELKDNSIVLRGFNEADEKLIKDYLFLITGSLSIVCS